MVNALIKRDVRDNIHDMHDVIYMITYAIYTIKEYIITELRSYWIHVLQ